MDQTPVSVGMDCVGRPAGRDWISEEPQVTGQWTESTSNTWTGAPQTPSAIRIMTKLGRYGFIITSAGLSFDAPTPHERGRSRTLRRRLFYDLDESVCMCVCVHVRA